MIAQIFIGDAAEKTANAYIDWKTVRGDKFLQFHPEDGLLCAAAAFGTNSVYSLEELTTRAQAAIRDFGVSIDATRAAGLAARIVAAVATPLPSPPVLRPSWPKTPLAPVDPHRMVPTFRRLVAALRKCFVDEFGVGAIADSVTARIRQTPVDNSTALIVTGLSLGEAHLVCDAVRGIIVDARHTPLSAYFGKAIPQRDPETGVVIVVGRWGNDWDSICEYADAAIKLMILIKWSRPELTLAVTAATVAMAAATSTGRAEDWQKAETAIAAAYRAWGDAPSTAPAV